MRLPSGETPQTLAILIGFSLKSRMTRVLSISCSQTPAWRGNAPLGAISEDLVDSTFATNVKGLLFTVQKALHFLADGSAIILNASIVASKGLASNRVYSATKA